MDNIDARQNEDYFTFFGIYACKIYSDEKGKDSKICIYQKIVDEVSMVIKLLVEKIASEYEKIVKEKELKEIKIKLNDSQIKHIKFLNISIETTKL
ncbi:hypothetical protein JCM16816_04810 [Thermoanaerobacter brockii subsp. lactiethylicus]